MIELIIISIGLNLALMVSVMILFKDKQKHNNTYLRLVIKENKELRNIISDLQNMFYDIREYNKQLKKDIDLLAEIIIDGQDVSEIVIDYFYNDYELLERVNNTLKRNYKNYEDTLICNSINKEIDRLIEKEKEQRKEDE